MPYSRVMKRESSKRPKDPAALALWLRQPIGLDEGAEFLEHRVSAEAIRQGLVNGEVRGRNFSGRVGWMTSRGALLDWINGLPIVEQREVDEPEESTP